MRYSILLILGVISFLGGCAHKMAPVSEGSRSSNTVGTRSLSKEHKLRNITNWNIEGKLSAKTENEAIQASFNWKQKGPLYEITFFGPLGLTGGFLKGNTQSQMVSFQDARGRVTKAHSPEALIYQNTGFYFPVSHLQYWIRGLPHPKEPIEACSYNQAGLLMSLNQNDWNIQYIKYREHNDTPDLFLPYSLKIQNDAFSLKLVLNSWAN